MKKIGFYISALGIAVAPCYGLDKEADRLEAAAAVVREILDIPDGVPQELLDKAECIVVMPSVKKFAVGIGGSYGRGVMVCRSGSGFDGPWGAPAMYRLEGGNFGFQLGGEATDFIFLVMNPKGVKSLLKSKVKLTPAPSRRRRSALGSSELSHRGERAHRYPGHRTRRIHQPTRHHRFLYRCISGHVLVSVCHGLCHR